MLSNQYVRRLLWSAVLATTFAYQAWGVSLDAEGDLRFGARAYINGRIGTEHSHLSTARPTVDGGELSTLGTFPASDPGHIRQNRYFLELELDHKLDRLVKSGVGPLGLINSLPFRVRNLAYHATFRGEAESIYDWGPREYSTAEQFKQQLQVKLSPPLPLQFRNLAFPDVAAARQHLRDTSVHRERLFQAYGEGNFGKLYVRFGRQVLSWGETDAFQLMDHINPLDSSFGGFLIPLDERRIPLDMLRVSHPIPDIGPLNDMFIEGYAAIDNANTPLIPAGSPWALPSFGAMPDIATTYHYGPARNFHDIRGGGRLVFNVSDVTFSAAHFYTYFDTPGAQLYTRTNRSNPYPLRAFNDGRPCPVDLNDPSQGNKPSSPENNVCGSLIHVLLDAPRVQVSGLTSTFAVPSLYAVVRSEFAYFKGEAAYSQEQFDPFIFGVKGKSTGGTRTRDSVNFVTGFDFNPFIRFLNPNQTFFISTQFFYKHIQNAAGSRVLNADGAPNGDREILPVVGELLGFPTPSGTKVRPLYISQPADSMLHTLAITTSYFSSRVNPLLVMFYDWGGAFVYQPGITLSQDPFRFTVDYSIIDSHSYKGGSGVSLLKDRDNVQLRLEYVI